MTKKQTVLSIEKITIDGKPAIKFNVDGTSEKHKEVLWNAATIAFMAVKKAIEKSKKLL
jgi:hypothetical protein